jgi:hypothetical protein
LRHSWHVFGAQNDSAAVAHYATIMPWLCLGGQIIGDILTALSDRAIFTLTTILCSRNPG